LNVSLSPMFDEGFMGNESKDKLLFDLDITVYFTSKTPLTFI